MFKYYYHIYAFSTLAVSIKNKSNVTFNMYYYLLFLLVRVIWTVHSQDTTCISYALSKSTR